MNIISVPTSPFMAIAEFLSLKQCEQITDSLEFYVADHNNEGIPIPTYKHHEVNELVIYNKLQHIIPKIEQHYGVQYKGTERIMFEYYAAQYEQTDIICENSSFLRNNWVKTKDRDLTGILFLSDYNEHADFDSDYEVYGGKLEFPLWDFGFNPIRGTLIIYPSLPNFINATSNVFAGNLIQARLHISCKTPYLFDPNNFSGNYTDWFLAD